MLWKRMLAYITGPVNEGLLHRIEYLLGRSPSPAFPSTADSTCDRLCRLYWPQSLAQSDAGWAEMHRSLLAPFLHQVIRAASARDEFFDRTGLSFPPAYTIPWRGGTWTEGTAGHFTGRTGFYIVPQIGRAPAWKACLRAHERVAA